MQRLQLMFIFVFAAATAGAANSDVHMNSSGASFLMNSSSASAMDFSAPTAMNGNLLPLATDMKLGPVAARSGFSAFGGDVIREVKATSIFVRKQAAKARTHDGRLISLTAFLLVILQLRRKHNSLPQRQITAHG
ncbi:MAG: hypothetical protein ABJC66_09720 [Gammaproteobacteria bacterium]